MFTISKYPAKLPIELACLCLVLIFIRAAKSIMLFDGNTQRHRQTKWIIMIVFRFRF